MARYFEVTLKRSAAGRSEGQRRVVEGMGLKHTGRTVYLKDTPANRGMIYKVIHLLEVTPKEGAIPASSRSRARAQA